ncbi:hypothetical protein D3C81_1638460 [compost metagenome]
MGRTVADCFSLIASHFIARIEQSQGVVRAFDERTEANETKRIITHDRAVRRTTEQVRTFLDPLAETAHAIATEALFGDAANFQPRRIDVLPHVRRDAPTHRMGTGPRRAEAAVNARRVSRIEGKKMQQTLSM